MNMNAFLLSFRKSRFRKTAAKTISSVLTSLMIVTSNGIIFQRNVQARTVSLTAVKLAGSGSVSDVPVYELDIKGMRRGSSFAGSREAQLVLIRDLHCQLEAQMGIAGAIRQIHSKTGISRVFLEGAEGAVRTLLYESFPNETVRKMVGKEFVKNGYLTGAEYAAIESGVSAGLELYGVEEARLYVENLKAFRETRSQYAEIKEETDRISEWMGVLKNAGFSKKLQRVERVHEMIDGKRTLELEKALNTLSEVIAETEDQAQVDPFARWPEVSKLNRAFQINSEINQEAVDAEMSALISLLEKSLVKEELKEMISRALRYRLGQIPVIEYAGYLKKMYEENELGKQSFAEEYPQLEKWYEVSGIQENIEFEILMQQLEELVGGLRNRFAKNEDVGDIIQLYDRWRLVEKLMSLELRQEDLKKLKEQGMETVKEQVFQALSGAAARYPAAGSAPGEPAGLDGVITSGRLFYDCASKRDHILVTKTLERFKGGERVNKGSMKGKGILVTGGFHTQGIEAILKEKGVSYLTLTPMVTRGVDLALYEERMMDNGYDLDGVEFSDKRLAWRARTDEVLRMLAAPVLLGNILGGQGGEELLVRMVNNGMSAEEMEPNEVVNTWLAEMGIEDISRQSPEALRTFVAANMDQVHFLFSVLGASEVASAVINISTLGESQVEKELVCGLCRTKGWSALDRLADAYFGVKEDSDTDQAQTEAGEAADQTRDESPDAGVSVGDDGKYEKEIEEVLSIRGLTPGLLAAFADYDITRRPIMQFSELAGIQAAVVIRYGDKAEEVWQQILFESQTRLIERYGPAVDAVNRVFQGVSGMPAARSAVEMILINASENDIADEDLERYCEEQAHVAAIDLFVNSYLPLMQEKINGIFLEVLERGARYEEIRGIIRSAVSADTDSARDKESVMMGKIERAARNAAMLKKPLKAVPGEAHEDTINEILALEGISQEIINGFKSLDMTKGQPEIVHLIIQLLIKAGISDTDRILNRVAQILSKGRAGASLEEFSSLAETVSAKKDATVSDLDTAVNGMLQLAADSGNESGIFAGMFIDFSSRIFAVLNQETLVLGKAKNSDVLFRNLIRMIDNFQGKDISDEQKAALENLRSKVVKTFIMARMSAGDREAFLSDVNPHDAKTYFGLGYILGLGGRGLIPISLEDEFKLTEEETSILLRELREDALELQKAEAKLFEEWFPVEEATTLKDISRRYKELRGTVETNMLHRAMRNAIKRTSAKQRFFHLSGNIREKEELDVASIENNVSKMLGLVVVSSGKMHALLTPAFIGFMKKMLPRFNAEALALGKSRNADFLFRNMLRIIDLFREGDISEEQRAALSQLRADVVRTHILSRMSAYDREAFLADSSPDAAKTYFGLGFVLGADGKGHSPVSLAEEFNLNEDETEVLINELKEDAQEIQKAETVLFGTWFPVEAGTTHKDISRRYKELRGTVDINILHRAMRDAFKRVKAQPDIVFDQTKGNVHSQIYSAMSAGRAARAIDTVFDQVGEKELKDIYTKETAEARNLRWASERLPADQLVNRVRALDKYIETHPDLSEDKKIALYIMRIDLIGMTKNIQVDYGNILKYDWPSNTFRILSQAIERYPGRLTRESNSEIVLSFDEELPAYGAAILDSAGDIKINMALSIKRSKTDEEAFNTIFHEITHKVIPSRVKNPAGDIKLMSKLVFPIEAWQQVALAMGFEKVILLSSFGEPELIDIKSDRFKRLTHRDLRRLHYGQWLLKEVVDGETRYVGYAPEPHPQRKVLLQHAAKKFKDQNVTLHLGLLGDFAGQTMHSVHEVMPYVAASYLMDSAKTVSGNVHGLMGSEKKHKDGSPRDWLRTMQIMEAVMFSFTDAEGKPMIYYASEGELKARRLGTMQLAKINLLRREMGLPLLAESVQDLTKTVAVEEGEVPGSLAIDSFTGSGQAETGAESPDAGVRVRSDDLVDKDQMSREVLEMDKLRGRQTLAGGPAQAERGFPVVRDLLRAKLDGKISSEDMGMIESVFTKILQMDKKGKAAIPVAERAGYHDLFHTMEVALDALNNALESGLEGRALAAVVLGALLHDRSMLVLSAKQYNNHEHLSAEGVEEVLGLEPGDEMAVAVNRIILMTQFADAFFMPAVLLNIAEGDVEGWPAEKTAAFKKEFQLRRAGAVVALADLKSAFASDNYIDMVGGLFREYIQTDGANRETSTFLGNLGWISAYDVFAGTSFFINLAFNLRLIPLWKEAVQSTEEDLTPRTGDVQQDIAVNQKLFGLMQGMIAQLQRGESEPLTPEQEDLLRQLKRGVIGNTNVLSDRSSIALMSLVSVIEAENATLKGESLPVDLLGTLRSLRSDSLYAYDVNRILIINAENARVLDAEMENDLTEAERYFGTTLVEQELVIGNSQLQALRDIRDLDQAGKKEEAQVRRLRYENADPYKIGRDGAFEEDADGKKVKKPEWAALAAPNAIKIGNHIKIYEARLRAVNEYAARAAEARRLRTIKNIDLSSLGDKAELGRLALDVIREKFDEIADLKAPGSRKFIVKGISYAGSGAYKKVFKVTVDTDRGEIVVGIRIIQPIRKMDLDASIEDTIKETRVFQETDKLDGVAVNVDKVYVHKAQYNEKDASISDEFSDVLSARLLEKGVHAVTIGDFVEGNTLDEIEDANEKKIAYADAVRTVIRTWLLSMEKEESDYLEEDEKSFVGYAIQDMKGANFVRADLPERQTIQKRLESVVSIDFGQAQKTYLHMVIGFIRTDLLNELGLHNDLDREWTKEAIDFAYLNIIAAIDDFIARERNSEKHSSKIEAIMQIRSEVSQQYVRSLKQIGEEPLTSTETPLYPVTITEVTGEDAGVSSEAADTAVGQGDEITDHDARNLTLGQRMVNDEVLGVDSQGNAVRYRLTETERKAGSAAEEETVELDGELASKIAGVYAAISSAAAQLKEGVLPRELAESFPEEYLDKNGLRYSDDELAERGLTGKDRYNPLLELLETINSAGIRMLKDRFFIDEFGEYKIIAHSAQNERYGGKRTWLTEMEIRLLSQGELLAVIVEEGLHLQRPDAKHGKEGEQEKGKIYHNNALLQSIARKLNQSRAAFRQMMRIKDHSLYQRILSPEIFAAADGLASQMKSMIAGSGLNDANRQKLIDAVANGEIQGPIVLQEQITALQLIERLSAASLSGDETAINEQFDRELGNNNYSANTLRSFYLEVLSLDEATSVAMLNSIEGLLALYQDGRISGEVLAQALQQTRARIGDSAKTFGLTPLGRLRVAEATGKAIQEISDSANDEETGTSALRGESKDAGISLGGALPGKPDPGEMQRLGPAHIGGEKDKEFWVDAGGNLWIFKKNPYAGQPYRPLGAELFYRFARRHFGSSVEVYEMTLNGHRGSIEKVVFSGDTSDVNWSKMNEFEINMQFAKLAAPNVKKLMNQGELDLLSMPKTQQKAVLREMVVDWLFSNNDAHPANFIMDSNGIPVGIDKEQVFKYFGKDRLDLTYLPNGEQFAPLSYFILMSLAMKGELSIGLIEDVLAQIESIADSELVELIRPFAKEYAAAHPDMTEDAFIRMFLGRKARLRKDFIDFFNRINEKHGIGIDQGITEIKSQTFDLSKIKLPEINFDPISIPTEIIIKETIKKGDGNVQYNSQLEMQSALAGMYGVDEVTASRMQDAAQDPDAMVALLEDEFGRLTVGQPPAVVVQLEAKKAQLIAQIRNPGASEQKLQAVLRLLAAWIDRVNKQMGDHHRVYLARDGGYFNLTDERLRSLGEDKEYEGGSSVYHLSRASMSGEKTWNVYLRMNKHIIPEAKKASKGDMNVFYSEMRRLFREEYETNKNFKKIVDAVKEEMRELGYDKQKKLAFVDTGFMGTNPMFLKMVLEMDRSAEELVDETGEQRIKVAIIQPSSIHQFAGQLFGFDLDALDETQRRLVRGIAQQFNEGRAVGSPLEALIHPIGFNQETWEMEKTGPSTQLEVFYQKMITVQMAHAHHERKTGVGDDSAALLEMITKDFGLYLTDFSSDYIPPKAVSEAFNFEMPKYEPELYEITNLQKIDVREPSLQEMFNNLGVLERIEMFIKSFLPRFLYPFITRLFDLLRAIDIKKFTLLLFPGFMRPVHRKGVPYYEQSNARNCRIHSKICTVCSPFLSPVFKRCKSVKKNPQIDCCPPAYD